MSHNNRGAKDEQGVREHRRPQYIHQIAAILLLAVCLGKPAASAANDLLGLLRVQLRAVRALPDGSRPNPPQLDLTSLEGIARSTIRRALGKPTYCDEWKSSACAHASVWMYVWGPPAAAPQRDSDGSIVVTTGGPWLLVLEFSGDRVAAERFEGQK
jgi:hypothetical protein